MKFWATMLEEILFYSLILFIPTQLGKHFWPDFSYIAGIRIDYLSPTVYFTDVLILSLFLLWTYRIVFIQKVRPQIHRPFLLYLSFLLYLASIILVSHSVAGWYFLLKFVEFSFITYYVASTVKSFKQLQMISLLICLSVIGESLLALAHYVNHGSLGGILYFLGERFFTSQTPGIANASINGELVLRPYGTFSHPNVLAGFLVVALSLTLLFARHQIVKLPMWFFAFTLSIGSLALFLTFSRVAIILWIFVLLFFYFSRGKALQVFTKKKYILFAFLLFSFALMFFLQTPLLQRFIETTRTEESFVQRQELAISAFHMIQQHPLFGVGLGQFLPTLYTFQQPLSLSYHLQPVHNIFLLVLAEIGIVGGSFVVLFLYKTYQRLRFTLRTVGIQSSVYVSLGIVLSLQLCLGVFDHYWLTLQQGQLLLSIMLGLIWSSVKVGNSKPSISGPQKIHEIA